MSNKEGALELGTDGAYNLLEKLKTFAKEKGFEELKITYTRTAESSSKVPGHSITKEFKLN